MRPMHALPALLLAATTAANQAAAAETSVTSAGAAEEAQETPSPEETDPDRDRVLRLQEALSNIVGGPILGRLRVGMRVIDLGTGRVLFGQRGTTLMDPASNQKVLATATALLRLGNAWRFRTELFGPLPGPDGTIEGDVVLRGTGDPSLRGAHLEAMATSLVARGVRRITGAALAHPLRLGSHERGTGERPPLRVGRSAIDVRVRPGWRARGKPEVTLRPLSDAIEVHNRATTGGRGRSRIRVSLATVGDRIRVTVSGRIPARHPGVLVRRRPPHQILYAAIMLRAALVQAGIEVVGRPGVLTPRRRHRAVETASANSGSDTPLALDPVLAHRPLAVHTSEPLSVLIRRINKDSDNEWAERLLETVGAEIYGGAATPAKGVRALRDVADQLGLKPDDYVPVNGSGLGHQNRITADAMAELLRALYLDPRIGPDVLQSLSVGGIDGTIRNRFRGSPAAERVRAKTGTLRGKSILSGYVGDGSDVLVFSMMVQGLRSRSLTKVRQAQVSAVDAMMRYARGAEGPTPGEEVEPGVDFEVGEEIIELEAEEPESADAPPEPEGKTPTAPSP